MTGARAKTIRPGMPDDTELEAMAAAFAWAVDVVATGGEFEARGREVHVSRAPAVRSFASLDVRTAGYVLQIASGRPKPWAAGYDEWAVAVACDAAGDPERIACIRVRGRQTIGWGFTLHLADPGAPAALELALSGARAILVGQPDDATREALARTWGLARGRRLPDEAVEIRLEAMQDFRNLLAGSWWAHLSPEAASDPLAGAALMTAMQARSVRQEVTQTRHVHRYAESAVRRAARAGRDAHALAAALGVPAEVLRGAHPPSQKQLAFAGKLAMRHGIEIPAPARQDAGECSRFIDAMLARQPPTPPTPKQAAFVDRLVEEFPFLADHIDPDGRTSRFAVSHFLGALTPRLDHMRRAARTGDLETARRLAGDAFAQ